MNQEKCARGLKQIVLGAFLAAVVVAPARFVSGASNLDLSGQDPGSIGLPGQSQGPGQAGDPVSPPVPPSVETAPTPVAPDVAGQAVLEEPGVNQQQGSGGTGKSGCNAKTCSVSTTSTGSISNPPTEGCVTPPCTPDDCDEGCEQTGGIRTQKGSTSRIIDYVNGTYTVTVTCIAIRTCVKPTDMTTKQSIPMGDGDLVNPS